MKIEIPLDDIDTKILLALEEIEKDEKGDKNTSTTKLSKMLGIPGRTIRYHINKLRENKVIHPPNIQTYERKLGLGERIILFQSVPEKDEELKKVLHEINFFYHYSTTYGKYNGYFVYTMFPLVNPRITNRVADELMERGLINDYYIFDAIDYRRKGANVEPFLPESNWSWDIWREEVENIMENGCKFPLHLDEFPKTVRFDMNDIKILKYMVEHKEPTLKEICEVLDLSMTQVHKRVKRLEKEGVIKGTLPVFSPCEKSTFIVCFFESRKSAEKILCGFYKLPFDVNYVMESSRKYSIGVFVPNTELNEFLSHIEMFRKYTEEFFIQVMVKETSKGYGHLLEFFNEKSNSWEMPVTEIMQTIRAVEA